MFDWQEHLNDKTKELAKNNNFNNNSIEVSKFDIQLARDEFDKQWQYLMKNMDKDYENVDRYKIVKIKGSYFCYGRRYSFSTLRESINQEISIIVDGFKDISQSLCDRILFQIICEVDVNKKTLTYYTMRDEKNKKIIEVNNINDFNYDYKEIIKKLMYEAIK